MVRLHTSMGFLLGIIVHGSVSPQDYAKSYTYPSAVPKTDFHSGYQWRPEETFSQGEGNAPTFRGGAELLPGGTQSTFGLPPGVYRPLESQRSVSPQVGAYRFRSISPEEQSRPKRTESQVSKENYNPSSGYQGYSNDRSQPFNAYERQQRYRFRPDERFPEEEYGRQNRLRLMKPQHQTYPPTYPPLIFRQENKGKR